MWVWSPSKAGFYNRGFKWLIHFDEASRCSIRSDKYVKAFKELEADTRGKLAILIMQDLFIQSKLAQYMRFCRIRIHQKTPKWRASSNVLLITLGWFLSVPLFFWVLSSRGILSITTKYYTRAIASAFSPASNHHKRHSLLLTDT